MKTFVTVYDAYGEFDIALEDICAYHKPSCTLALNCVLGTGNGMLQISEGSFDKVMQLLGDPTWQPLPKKECDLCQ